MINPKRADFEIMAIIGPFTMSFDIANIRDGRDTYSDRDHTWCGDPTDGWIKSLMFLVFF